MNAANLSPVPFHLNWFAEYHGANPFAGSAVVVGELTGESAADMAQLKVACANLWVQSGMQRGADGVSNLAGEDVRLALGQAATEWALAVLNEVRGYVIDAGAEQAGDVVCLWVGFHDAALSRVVLQLALGSLIQLMSGQSELPSLKTDLNVLWQACRASHPDYQARILMVGAKEMDVPHLQFLTDTNYWQFGWGTKARVFMESSSNADGVLGFQWENNKAITKALLTTLGLPTPVHVLLDREEGLPAAVERVGFPCVVKPLDSGAGKGVTANIQSVQNALTAYRVAFSQKQGLVMVEAHVQGDDHRLMVIDGQFVAAIRREPSFILGDGHKTVAALVHELNAPRSSNMVRSCYLRPIEMDEVLDLHLAKQSLTLNDVPVSGRRITLRSNANLSTGGICTDVTAICHPQVRAMALLLAQASGLSTVGIDYLTTDIASGPVEAGGTFIEMNTTPGLDACIAAGWSEASIARLVLGKSVGRIPVSLHVLSSAGIDALQADLGKIKVGVDDAIVVEDVVYFQGVVLRVGISEPWASVKASLKNPAVKSVLVFCTADRLNRYGCPVDRFLDVNVEVRAGNVALSEKWLNILRRLSENGVTLVSQ